MEEQKLTLNAKKNKDNKFYISNWRPGTEKAIFKFTNPYQEKIKPICEQEKQSNLVRPQTLVGHRQPNETYISKIKATANINRIQTFYGGEYLEYPNGKPSTNWSNKGQKYPLQAIVNRGRMTAEHFFPMLKPITQNLPKELNYAPKGVLPNPGGYNSKPVVIQSNFKEIYTRKLRPNTGARKQGGYTNQDNKCPDTSQIKKRTQAKEKAVRIMRLSTPQTVAEKRPDSRYNQATVCVGLNNNREKSPDYRVPILPMKFSENSQEQAVLPNCWKQ